MPRGGDYPDQRIVHIPDWIIELPNDDTYHACRWSVSKQDFPDVHDHIWVPFCRWWLTTYNDFAKGKHNSTTDPARLSRHGRNV